MMSRIFTIRRANLIGFVAVLQFAQAVCASQPHVLVKMNTQETGIEALNRLPPLFVKEEISDDGKVGFVVRGSQATVWLSDVGIRYRLHPSGVSAEIAGSWVVALDLVGAALRQPAGVNLLPTRVSHFNGTREHWRTNLAAYGSAVYRELWPGVDLVVEGSNGRLKSSFVVRPGADPSTIRLAYRGARSVRLAMDGSLVVDTPLGVVREEAPFAYQLVDGRRMRVEAAYELENDPQPGRYGYHFSLGAYDPDRELVVDPVSLVYCGYIGGSGGDETHGIAVSDTGEVYIVGKTFTSDASFPVTVGPDLTFNGGNVDSFVAKVNAAGTALEYCGFIGGLDNDNVSGISIDAAGNAYVVGDTASTEATFPVTIGPDLTHNGGGNDVFVAKINATGTSLDFCGFIGGSGFDSGDDIAVDGAGKIYITGETQSNAGTFPVTVGPDLTFNGGSDAFVANVAADGTYLEYCGYIGGANAEGGNGIAVDQSGRVYIVGSTNSTEASFPVTVGPDLSYNGSLDDYDAFVARVNASGTALDYCGYIGGSDRESASAIAVDAAGRAFIAGFTFSTESTFPVVVGPDLSHNGANDVYVARVTADGSALDRCGFIGGSGFDSAADLALDGSGNVHVFGLTTSAEDTFPVSNGPDLTYNGGDDDAFVAGVDSSFAALSYCGYIGGSDKESRFVSVGGIALSQQGHLYVCGLTYSDEATFPIVVGPDVSFNGSFDGFVAKLFLGLYADGFEFGDTSAWSATVP